MDPIDYIKNGNYISLLDLLKKGLDPNYVEEGVSLLHYSVAYDQYAIAKLLIEWGADPYRKDDILKESPYDAAVEAEDEEFTILFKKRKLS